MAVLHETILNLSLDDLRHWAGSKILNRGKSYQRHVYDLTRTRDGCLLASVSGTDDYETWIGVDEDDGLDFFCTCPYDWGACKHAVAVILAGLALVKAGEPIPLAAADDERYLLINADFNEDDDEYDDCGQSPDTEAAVQTILQKKKKSELLAMLVDYAGRFPEVRQNILETDQLQSGDIKKLVHSLAAEIDEVTQEDAYYNSWRDEGSLPDYSHIQQQLAALLSMGHADEVVELGRQLWEQGSEQVGQSHDDGETADEVAYCMEIVFKAVAASSMSAPEQLLWYIDVSLEDDYSLSDNAGEYIESERYRKAHWQEVASVLQARLTDLPKPKGEDDYSVRYRRERIMNRLIQAYEKTGQPELVLPLLEKEVHALQCYNRLVDRLLDDGEIAKAREWCIKGYERTRNKAAGTASRLQGKLRELAQHEQNPELVAAYRAQDFFAQPGLNSYLDLQKACEEKDHWSDVRAAVMNFLEKGRQPDLAGKNSKWPLPAPEVDPGKGNGFRQDFPMYGVLIDIAIHEKRLDDVVDLHKRQHKGNRWHSSRDQEVAKAVAASHPEVALALWHKLALHQIGLVKPAAYEVAATYLGKMRRVYQQIGQMDKWQELIRSIRTEHKRKRRLLEVLDSMEGKRIID
jgi:uncharacterized Zn finger protein